jgi:hypothetical protein
LSGPGTVVVKWEAGEPATRGLKETLAPCDCEVWIYRAPQPDGHGDLETWRLGGDGKKDGKKDGLTEWGERGRAFMKTTMTSLPLCAPHYNIHLFSSHPNSTNIVPIQAAIEAIESHEPGASFLYTQVAKTYGTTLNVDAKAPRPIPPHALAPLSLHPQRESKLI